MRIAFLHTAQIHVETFESLFSQIDETIDLEHCVAPELLERARAHGLESVREDVTKTLMTLSRADAVVCTCSTLGPLADDAAESAGHIFRIDRPMMEQACLDGTNILVAICLDSTRKATLDLLEDCARRLNRKISPRLVICADAWPHFEAGDMDAFALQIAAEIKSALSGNPRIDSIVLAQASMRVAEPALGDLQIPIRSSPLLAARHSVTVAAAGAAPR